MEGASAAAEVVLEGEGFRWSLSLLRWEFPHDRRGEDANWIEAEVDLVVETVGRFTARRTISVRSWELGDFADELAALLQTGAGGAALELTQRRDGAAGQSERG